MIEGIRIQNHTIFADNQVGILLGDLGQERTNPDSLMSAGISPDFALSNLTAFIGRNATGKSSFFDALSFLSESTTLGCPQASTQKGRPGFGKLLHESGKPMTFECLFRMPNGDNRSLGVYVSYYARFDCDTYGRPYYSAEKVVRIAKTADGLSEPKTVLDLINGTGNVYCGGQMVEGGVSDKRYSALRSYGAIVTCPELSLLYRELSHWFFCCFSCDHSKRGNGAIAPGGHRHLNAIGSNMENVLSYHQSEDPRKYQEMLERITSKIPSIRKSASSLPASFRKSPDKLFLYLLLLSDPTPRPLICIETPDMGLYHDMVDVLASEFRDYSVRFPFSQIMFTTHNPYILESIAPQEVWVFKRHEEKTNQVSIECAGSDPIVAEMYRQGVGMGAIWYAGHFDEPS